VFREELAVWGVVFVAVKLVNRAGTGPCGAWEMLDDM
jgi:hypothetical protein